MDQVVDNTRNSDFFLNEFKIVPKNIQRRRSLLGFVSLNKLYNNTIFARFLRMTVEYRHVAKFIAKSFLIRRNLLHRVYLVVWIDYGEIIH